MSLPKKENKKWFYKYIHTISSIHNIQPSIHTKKRVCPWTHISLKYTLISYLLWWNSPCFITRSGLNVFNLITSGIIQTSQNWTKFLLFYRHYFNTVSWVKKTNLIQIVPEFVPRDQSDDMVRTMKVINNLVRNRRQTITWTHASLVFDAHMRHQSHVLLLECDAVARLLANGSAAFKESCAAIGWKDCDSIRSLFYSTGPMWVNISSWVEAAWLNEIHVGVDTTIVFWIHSGALWNVCCDHAFDIW